MVTLHHGDCLEFMRGMADNSVDAVVTDPPYGIDWNTDYTRFPNAFQACVNKAHKPVESDAKPFDPLPFLEFAPVVVMFGANHFSNKLPAGTLLVWVKRRDSMLGKWLADAEVAWMNKGAGVYILQHEWHGALKASEHNTKRHHPTQKPVEVMKWLIDKAKVPAGATVFDPFMGSGTTGVACVQTGRNFIGCEISEDYFKIAKRRIAEAQAQHQIPFAPMCESDGN